MELAGRSYGGGVLKLEPTEMQRVRVVLPTCSEAEFRDHFETADRLIRSGVYSAAVEVANQVILKEQLGLSSVDLLRVEQARSSLLERRQTRAVSNRR